MSLPAWPTTLGDLRPNRDTFSAKLIRPPKMVEFEDGPIGARSAGTFVEAPMALSIRLTPAQLVVFKAFVRSDLKMGSARFTAPIIQADLSIASKTCRISGEVELKPDGMDWSVSFPLLVWGW